MTEASSRAAALPHRFASTIRGEWLPYDVRLELEVVKHQVRCTSIKFEARDEPLASAPLRAIPFRRCVELAVTSAMRPVRREGGKLEIDVGNGRVELDLSGRRRAPRHTLTDEQLQEVADLYRRGGEHGTQLVFRAHSLGPANYNTAAQWVRKARERGFLPPTNRKPRRANNGQASA